MGHEKSYLGSIGIHNLSCGGGGVNKRRDKMKSRTFKKITMLMVIVALLSGCAEWLKEEHEGEAIPASEFRCVRYEDQTFTRCSFSDVDLSISIDGTELDVEFEELESNADLIRGIVSDDIYERGFAFEFGDPCSQLSEYEGYDGEVAVNFVYKEYRNYKDGPPYSNTYIEKVSGFGALDGNGNYEVYLVLGKMDEDISEDDQVDMSIKAREVSLFLHIDVEEYEAPVCVENEIVK